MDDLKIYGGPGTGKTRTGQDWLQERIEEGADLSRVAFVSYTNAAVDEAKERLAVRFGLYDPDRELPYCRTLHSSCKRALGVTQDDWLADGHLREFAEEFGYDLKPTRKKVEEEGIEARAEAGEDAPLLAVWDFARQRFIQSPYEGFREFSRYDVEGAMRLLFPRFEAFVKNYEKWKDRQNLRDYTDLLLELVQYPVSLPVSVAVIDEAQDLSPLMWRAADVLYQDAELRATLGDDDQAIYSFSGGEPSLMNRRPAREIVKLRQSHRLAGELVRASQWIIGQNRDREPKELSPLREGGTVQRIFSLEQAPLSNGESWFLLARNWKLMEEYTAWLEDAGIPYRIQGKRYSPWDDRGPRRAAECVQRLSKGEDVTVTDVLALAEKTPSATAKKAGVWAHGAKTRLRGLDTTDRVTWRDLFTLGMTEDGFSRVMRGDMLLMEGKVSERDLRAYQRAIRKGTFGQPTRVDLGSIHSVKGQERDNVVCLIGCTGASARALLYPHRAEEERRVAYVGMTRARSRFYALKPQPGPGIYDWNVMGV